MSWEEKCKAVYGRGEPYRQFIDSQHVAFGPTTLLLLLCDVEHVVHKIDLND